MTDGNDTYETIVILRSLIPQVLHMAHDKLGHNGTHRTYVLLKRLYYWKGLKPSVERHIKRCPQCQSQNKQLNRLLSLFVYILEDSGSAENKEELLFSHDKLSLASILRLLHQVTKEMLV